jgi:hypothetical protein
LKHPKQRSRYDHNKILQDLRENHVGRTAHKALLRFLHPQAQYQKRAGILPAPQGCRRFEKKQETRHASLPEKTIKPIEQCVREADALGLTYGQYVARGLDKE